MVDMEASLVMLPPVVATLAQSTAHSLIQGSCLRWGHHYGALPKHVSCNCSVAKVK